MDEMQLREQICEMGRRMYAKGYVAANDGNISCRLAPGRFLCTPTMVSKGFMSPDDICIVDDTGRQLAGPKQRTSEILLHLEIYHELDGINAVCHAHPPHATAFAIAGVAPPTCVLPEVELFLGPIPLAPYETPGSKDFARTILPHLRNHANTILLANHGVVACDKDLESAYWHLETLDMYCQMILLAKQAGNINRLEDAKVRELLALKQRLGITDPRLGGAAPAPDGDT
jgi:L-fuculose-phosphate aldolase